MESSSHIPQTSTISPASSISSSTSSSSSCSSTPATLPSIQQRRQQQHQLQQYVQQQRRISQKNSLSKPVSNTNTNTSSNLTMMSGSLNTPDSPNTRNSQTLPKLIPRNFFECTTSDIIILVSSMLQELVVLNDALPFDAQNLTRFHSRSQPPISIVDYLARITKFCSLEKSIIMAMIYYIDLLCTTYKTFNINSLTVHRFLITSAMVASKGLCDTFCTNTHYAKVGGLSRVELNLLEVEFLIRVDYRIVPPADRLNQYFERMVRRLNHKYKFQDSHLKQHQVPPQQQQKSQARDVDVGGKNAHDQMPANSVKSTTSPTPNAARIINTTVNTNNPFGSSAPTSEDCSQNHKNASASNGVVLASEVALREGRQNMSSKLKRRSTPQDGNISGENMVDNNKDNGSTNNYTSTQNPFHSMNDQPTSNCSYASRHVRTPSKIRIGDAVAAATTTNPTAIDQDQLSSEKSRNECANFNTSNNNSSGSSSSTSGSNNTIMTSNETNDQTNTNSYNTNKTLLAISTLKDLTPEELQQVQLQLQKRLADSDIIQQQPPHGFKNPFENHNQYDEAGDNNDDSEIELLEGEEADDEISDNDEM